MKSFDKMWKADKTVIKDNFKSKKVKSFSGKTSNFGYKIERLRGKYMVRVDNMAHVFNNFYSAYYFIEDLERSLS